MQQGLVTLEVVRRYIGQEGVQKPGLPGQPNYVTVSPKRARELLESRVCRVPAGAPQAGEAPAGKKSSGAPTDGLTTDMRSSSALGMETPLSSSAEGLPSPRRTRRARDRSVTARDADSAS